MGKPLDPTVVEILKRYELDPKECLWDCKGTWVMYHRYLEQVGARAGIQFLSNVQVAYSDGESCALIIYGELGDKIEWSIGEASPRNTKNAYHWSMAEKRGKDRVILKLLGLHGFVYSEEEADEFKESKPKPKQDYLTGRNPELAYAQLWETLQAPFWDRQKLLQWWNSDSSRQSRHEAGLTREMISDLRTEIERLHPKSVELTQAQADNSESQTINFGTSGG